VSVPAAGAQFVGRQEELAQIGALFSDPTCRLLTLVGPGGIGKTRLALETAQQLAPPDAAYFVPLQPLTASDFIVPTLAEALGFQFYGAEQKQQLLDSLREKPFLLVLDNFEHLLDGTTFLSDILAAAPNVRLLVTSRERLNLVEEWVLEVGGLAYPASASDADAEQYSAVRLFAQHARRVKAGFALSDHNRAAVIRVCQMVEGMPLGIELAAAWVRSLTCEAIAEEISHSLDILETPARNVEPRHRTMRAAIEPTWGRLSASERAVFMRLSIFRGGFTREAAEAVAGASLRMLTALVDKSLVRVEADGRYDLHELLRQFGADKLVDAGETHAVADRHLAYFLTLAERAEAHLFGSEQVVWFDRVEDDLDNLRMALSWSLESETGLRLASALGWFFTERAHWNEGYSWLERVLVANPDAPSLLYAKALHTAGPLAWFAGNYERARLLCEQSLALARAINDRWNIAWALAHLGQFGGAGRDLALIAARFEESLALFRELDDATGIAHLLMRRCWVASAQNDYLYARALLKEAESRARRAGDRVILGWVFHSSGGIARDHDRDLIQAKTLIESSVTLFREARFQMGVKASLNWLGELELALGNFIEAQTRNQEALLSLRQIEPGDPYLTVSFVTLARVASIQGQFERAVRLFAAAHHIDAVYMRHTDYFDADLTSLRVQFGDTAFAQAWADGSVMSHDQAIAYALEYSRAIAIPSDTPESSRAQNGARQTQVSPLSNRELEILRLIAEGYANAEIAARLVLATSTVKWYVHSILDKLSVTSRTQAVACARDLGLLT
jgi:predicted ATPase/DNA-binding NarL/FixJ family response regulator